MEPSFKRNINKEAKYYCKICGFMCKEEDDQNKSHTIVKINDSMLKFIDLFTNANRLKLNILLHQNIGNANQMYSESMIKQSELQLKGVVEKIQVEKNTNKNREDIEIIRCIIENDNLEASQYADLINQMISKYTEISSKAINEAILNKKFAQNLEKNQSIPENEKTVNKEEECKSKNIPKEAEKVICNAYPQVNNNLMKFEELCKKYLTTDKKEKTKILMNAYKIGQKEYDFSFKLFKDEDAVIIANYLLKGNNSIESKKIRRIKFRLQQH